MKALQSRLSSLLAQINELYPNVDFGTMHIVDDNDFVERLKASHLDHHDDVSKETHVIIDYDFSTDELDQAIDCNDPAYKALYRHIFNRFSTLHCDKLYSLIDELGHEHVETHDGSGNGLYYGAILIKL